MLQRVRQQLRAHFPPQPLQATRARARYSNTNYQLLIAAIEAATERPIHDVLHEQLFAPLRMHDTWHPAHPPARIDRPVIAPAALWTGDRMLQAPLMLQSLEDYYSTTPDLLRLLRALTGGALFANPQTWPAMCARWIRFSLPRDRAALRSPSWPIEYGLGVMRFEMPRWLAPLRPVPPILGHSGSTGSWLFHCPQRDLLLAGTVDQITAGAVPFRFLPKVLRELSG
ncbi:MAG TPA: serine hydrolase domain-containing protein, partial [Burkholderiaceae bacterium]|nr:serine hydrolase domain-containing protein [Burkholderiaceae bacterium]